MDVSITIVNVEGHRKLDIAFQICVPCVLRSGACVNRALARIQPKMGMMLDIPIIPGTSPGAALVQGCPQLRWAAKHWDPAEYIPFNNLLRADQEQGDDLVRSQQGRERHEELLEWSTCDEHYMRLRR